MVYILKKNNIIIIYGITISDILSSNKRDNHIIAGGISYDDIPKRFTSTKEWPKKTNLKCWYCDNIPESYPKFIPSNPEKDIHGNDTCDVVGNFCEWNCAVHYILTEYPYNNRSDAMQLLLLFESKFTGLHRVRIPSSPNKTLMKSFCGSNGMSKTEWYAKLKKIDTTYSLTV